MARRHRVTITIRDDLLTGLDRLVDHQKIRNRSHAVEYVLSNSLKHATKQAVILASGAGVAMRPFTYEIPKPLIPVRGKPILEHTIDLLRHHDIRDICITVSHLKEQIMKYFGDGSQFGVNIRYIEESTLRGTGTSLLKAQSYVTSSPFLVLYGDILIDLDITEFLKAHQENTAALATIALTSAVDPSVFGSVRMRGTRVTDFSEKPETTLTTSRLVFAGVMAMSPEVFSIFPKKGELSVERDIFPKLVQENRLYGFPFEGQWFDVSTPETYEHVLKEWHVNK